METLKNLNKFWWSSTLLPTTTTYDEEEEEESFFELEIVMLNIKTKRDDTTAGSGDKMENEGLSLTSEEVNNSATVNGGGRRVVPVEPDLKPQLNSPISILKSAPKFKVSLFRKHTTTSNNSDLNLNLKPQPELVDEELKAGTATISTLMKENNSPVQKQNTTKIEDSDTASKRFSSKDVMNKYLNLKLIKPLHLKVAKRCRSVITTTTTTNKSKLFELSDDCSAASPAPLKSRCSSGGGGGGGFRVACKQLGKSRSASSMVGSRREESLVVAEHDDGGIQSAILHCKRSFNPSRDDSSVLSRSSSDSGDQEQPSNII